MCDLEGGLELDVHLPDLELALEYQGQQHYHPIRAWGGLPALRKTQERDARKADLCREQGVTLVRVEYTEALTEEHIHTRIARARESRSP